MSSQPILPRLEALLFVSGEPLALARLRELLSLSEAELKAALSELAKRYVDDSHSGLMLIEHDGHAELATKPAAAPDIEVFTKSFLQENLSKPALEVLAIIAYRGPVNRSTIEAIRGVNCSFTLRNLLIRGLIDRTENPADAREYVYSVSFALLEKLGLGRQSDLPNFDTLSRDARLEQAAEASHEQ